MDLVSIKERNFITTKLFSTQNDSSCFGEREREFLAQYFQFQPDLRRTYILWPEEMIANEITFRKTLLFGINKQKNLGRLLDSKINGMMYFHARFNPDMTYAASEHLRVHLFITLPGADPSKAPQLKANVNTLVSPTLRKICKSYLHPEV